MRTSRRLQLAFGLAAALAIAGSWTRAVDAAPAPASTAAPRDELRRQALTGRIGWRTYLRSFRQLVASPFRETERVRNSPEKFRILEENRRSKFSIIRDLKALHSVEVEGKIETEHLLAIPIGARQPIWLSQMNRRDARRLGQMTREVLNAPRRLHQREAQTAVYFNLPGALSQPILHAHATWRSRPQPPVRRWNSFLHRNYRPLVERPAGDYQLYLATGGASSMARQWPILAVASSQSGSAADMSQHTDELLGRMLLDVARASLKQLPAPVLASGKIEVDRAEHRIVVHVERRPALEGEARRAAGSEDSHAK